MVNIANHGGGCCGISHLWDFSAHDEQTETKFLSLFPKKPGDRLYEVVLNDYQLQANDNAWAKVLEKAGFRLVTRFVNSNTDNYCNVFHFVNEVKRSDIPFPARIKAEFS